MCFSCDASDVTPGVISRRTLLAGLSTAALTIGATSCARTTQTSTTTTGILPARNNPKLELVLLGTMGGPPIQPDSAGISTALIVDGQVYLVDCGRKSATQYVNSGLQLGALRSIFITHLHADHIADYYNYFLLGGSVPNRTGDNITRPIRVYGPGPAGGLPPKTGGGEAALVGPSDPSPGTAGMTEKLHEAYAYSSNVFLRDTGIRDIRTLVEVTDIPIPSDIGASYTDTHPDMEPFLIMQDDLVTVTATLVPHGPVFPAFAFRFDTDYGSVTFSGDTAYSENLIRLAQGSNVLVHEAVNMRGVELPEVLRSHQLESHVEVQEVGPIAEKSRVPKLVLSHIGDMARQGPLDVKQWTEWASAGYSGEVVIGQDLQRLRIS